MSAALAQKGAPLSHTASAGKMTVLGLDGIRAMAGERWAKTSLSVHRFFEAKLQREMRPGDLFYRLDELSYLVVFRQLSLAEAQIKCVAIADQVCRLLFGEDASRIVVSCDPQQVSRIKEVGARHGILVEQIGSTIRENFEIAVDGKVVVSAALRELKQAWSHALERSLHVETEEHLVPELLQKS